MRTTLRTLRTATMSGAVLLYAVSASPQTTVTSQDHDHEHKTATDAAAKATLTAPERIAALDRRIQMLSADVRMFTGEMKVEAMASLISTMLERQALVESEMKSMRENMMRRMAARESSAAPAASQPESMCVPSN